jgi:hypothetical protein
MAGTSSVLWRALHLAPLCELVACRDFDLSAAGCLQHLGAEPVSLSFDCPLTQAQFVADLGLGQAV